MNPSKQMRQEETNSERAKQPKSGEIEETRRRRRGDVGIRKHGSSGRRINGFRCTGPDKRKHIGKKKKNKRKRATHPTRILAKTNRLTQQQKNQAA